MTTITQESVNIGPVPRCIKVADSGDFWMLAVCCVLGFALNKAFKWLTDEAPPSNS